MWIGLLCLGWYRRLWLKDNCWPGATRGLEKLLNIRRRTISASIQNEKDGRGFSKLRKDGRRRQAQRSGDRVRLCNTPQKSHGKPLMPCLGLRAARAYVLWMEGTWGGREGGVFPRPPAPRCRPGRVFQANGKIIIIVMARGTRGIEPRNTRGKKQNHEGARKNLRTTNRHEWARIKNSKPRKTRNTREKTKNHEGARKNLRTTNGHEGARIIFSKPRNTRKQEAAWGQNHGRASSRGTGSLFPDKVGLRQFVCIRSLSPLPRGRSVPDSFARIVSVWRA